MKHENIIMVVALAIFGVASSVVAYFLPFALSTLYIYGNYSFDLTLVKTLTDIYGWLVFVAVPALIMWIAIERILILYCLWQRKNAVEQNKSEQNPEV